MPQHPTTTMHLTPEDLEYITASACVTADGRLIGTIELAKGLELFTYQDLTPRDLARRLREVANELETAAIAKLSEAFKVAHPEEPEPIGWGGRCLGCGRVVPMLFTARVSLGGAEWECVEACAACANVSDDLADAFDSAVIKIDRVSA